MCELRALHTNLDQFPTTTGHLRLRPGEACETVNDIDSSVQELKKTQLENNMAQSMRPRQIKNEMSEDDRRMTR